MKVRKGLKRASTLIGGLAILSAFTGCGSSSDPVSVPLTEETATEQIKKIKADPNLPPEAKGQQIARIEQALKAAKNQNDSK